MPSTKRTIYIIIIFVTALVIIVAALQPPQQAPQGTLSATAQPTAASNAAKPSEVQNTTTTTVLIAVVLLVVPLAAFWLSSRRQRSRLEATRTQLDKDILKMERQISSASNAAAMHVSSHPLTGDTEYDDGYEAAAWKVKHYEEQRAELIRKRDALK